jgi:sporulation protein YlmC with PRC-barrel domain
MAQNDEFKSEWTGHDLFDLDGEKIGTIEDVRYGDASGDLKWLVVQTGFLGLKKVFVPVVEVKRSGDRLSVPYTKEEVREAPKVADDIFPTENEKAGICKYYGLDYVPATTGPQEDCVDTGD